MSVVSNKKDFHRVLENVLHEAINSITASLPRASQIALEVLDDIFVPKVIGRQLILAIVLEAGVLTVNQVITILQRIYSNFSSRSRLINQLECQQKKASTQDEWMDLAEQIDTIQGNDTWRNQPQCPLYESDRISSRVDEFMHLMRRGDVFDLMFTLRGGIARNKFGLLHEGLFSKAIAGSKVLVETYHNIVCAALDYVCDEPTLPTDMPIPIEARLAFFNETRHSYGRTALMLSGGAALGFYHVGVVKALMVNGLLPRVISGASAGSIVCAMVGTRTDEEFKQLFTLMGTNSPGHSGKFMFQFFRPVGSTQLNADDKNTRGKAGRGNPLQKVIHNNAGAFHDGKKTWQVMAPIGIRKFTGLCYDLLVGHRRATDLLKNDTEHFRNCCKTNIGNFTFQEAFDRTGRILNIIVSPQNKSDPPRLLNYLTAPHVLVWSAAVASSSLPGVFEPNKLMVKDVDGTERYESASVASFIDGSMEADLPMQQLSEMFNINHFIISQANPHAVMFSSFSASKSVWNNRVLGLVHGILFFLKKQVKEWVGDLIELIGGQRAAPMWDTRRGFGSQFVTQEYEGRDIDVSLIPWAGHRSLLSALLHCIYNPSDDEFQEWIQASERETWKYIPKIKSHVAEEMTLDRCVQRLRKQMISETVDNRLGTREETTEQMSKRVPSFFTSASLVNMSGLGITDGYNLDDDSVGTGISTKIHREIPADVPPGWKGMGLKGNFSSGSLNRSTTGSGLFPMDYESDDEKASTHSNVIQNAGEDGPKRAKSRSESHDEKENQYVKTTSMADFYYRRNASSPNLS